MVKGQFGISAHTAYSSRRSTLIEYGDTYCRVHCSHYELNSFQSPLALIFIDLTIIYNVTAT